MCCCSYTDVVERAWQGLSELGYEIVSTGGSASAIEAAGVPVQRVEELTGFPEMLDGTATPQDARKLSCHS